MTIAKSWFQRELEKEKVCNLCHLITGQFGFCRTSVLYLKPNHQVSRPTTSTCECDKAESSAHMKPGEQTKTELKFIIRLSGKWIAQKIKRINKIAEAVLNLL